jgi:hypothetical protein
LPKYDEWKPFFFRLNLFLGLKYFALLFLLAKIMLVDIFLFFVTTVCYSEYSMQLNASRIKVLQAQDDIVNSMKEVAAKELLNVSHHHLVEDILHVGHHEYRNLLKGLIVQVS